MSDIKSKILNVFASPQLMSFATLTEDGKPWVRYVIGTADENLIIRFATFITSRKVAQIRKNQDVHIVCGVSNMETVKHYIQVQGKAEITQDEQERKKFLHEDLEAYFSGVDDPNYCICIVKPYRIEYYTLESTKPEVWEG